MLLWARVCVLAAVAFCSSCAMSPTGGGEGTWIAVEIATDDGLGGFLRADPLVEFRRTDGSYSAFRSMSSDGFVWASTGMRRDVVRSDTEERKIILRSVKPGPYALATVGNQLGSTTRYFPVRENQETFDVIEGAVTYIGKYTFSLNGGALSYEHSLSSEEYAIASEVARGYGQWRLADVVKRNVHCPVVKRPAIVKVHDICGPA